MSITGPRGTYDILPDESRKWQWLEGLLRETAELYGFREIRTPVFEHTELFQRGVGETTDIVQKEMYTFADKARRSLTLRPEGTASCARAFIQHQIYNQPQPVKWYYLGPMFRYDRPQAGRYRQFHQFGAEVFGSNNPFVDAELIVMMVDMVFKAGLPQYDLRLNSVGCETCRPSYRQALVSFLQPIKKELCQDCRKRIELNPLRVLDCKNQGCREAVTGLPRVADYWCNDCRQHFTAVTQSLDRYEVSYTVDDRLVRGLDYYTNTAFELLVPGIGAQNAIGGGGRYNHLVREVGGPDVPGIGFAIGLERLLSGVEEAGALPVFSPDIEVYIAVTGREYEASADQALRELRRAGLKADRDYMGRSLKAQMRQADRLQVPVVVLIGEDEATRGTYTIRRMQTKEQYEIGQKDLIDEVRKILVK
ncbi:MAG TPA: histidine--tRNA ligase [Syntrophothermus lipocalidus]|nr:histidine--tRNA ligase [Syntrophothermus lipocalidus]